MNIDKPLDDLVQANRKSRSTRGGLARRGSAPRAPAAPRAAVVQDNSAGAAAARARYGGRASGPRTGGAPVAALPAQGAVVGDKIVISNLPDDVTEVQINVRPCCSAGPADGGCRSCSRRLSARSGLPRLRTTRRERARAWLRFSS